MRLADDDRGFEIIPEMAVHHARHRAIARHVDQRGGGCGTERHDLVIADHPVVDALRGERIDIGRAGQTDRFGARLRALLKREAEPDRGLARCARDQDLTRAIIALILELVGYQPAGYARKITRLTFSP